MTTPAQQAREALGLRLRDLRRDAGLTGRELAAAAGWYDSKVSKIEHGTQNPAEADIRTWCRLTGSTGQIPDLIATVRSIETMYVELRRQLRAGTAPRQRSITESEQKSSLLRGFQIFVIPGLFQTPEYAALRLAEGIEFLRLTNDMDAGVQARLERQQVLYRGDRRLHVVLCEAALTAGLAPPDIMLGQLDRLLTVSGLPRVRLGIIAARAPMYPPMSAFWIHDERLVLVETFTAELTINQPREVALYVKAFDRLAGSAVYGHQARALIAAAISTLEPDSTVRGNSSNFVE